MTKPKKEDQAVFLEDGRILPWKQPLPPGCISNAHMFNGSTEIKEYIGFDRVEEDIGKYRVLATATKYLANVARVTGIFCSEEKPTPAEEILFDGGVQIYERGEIPGTKIQGFNLRRNGEIWTAEKPPIEPLGVRGSQLTRVMFGYVMSEENVERILRGYSIQDRKRAEEESRNRSRLMKDAGRNAVWMKDHGHTF